jgi:hypothetical protein
MLFNYGGKQLNTTGISSLQTNIQSASNMYMAGASSDGRTRCNGYSMRGSMHTKSNPKKRCASCQ